MSKVAVHGHWARLNQHQPMRIEAMAADELAGKGRGLRFSWFCFDVRFGTITVAGTQRGISHISFGDEESEGFRLFRADFGGAHWVRERDERFVRAAGLVDEGVRGQEDLVLHVKGTPFQVEVWKVLARLGFGELITYSDVAGAAGYPRAVRAAASAVARNPVAVLVPCHRVIRSTGEFGQYRWSPERKVALIDFERSR
jgi:AraC family transcriptional regulator, regulatory protein of adaptative response / methylated-DNA-[protein]-cysteine methyltransferase